jgi:hypothetical protein
MKPVHVRATIALPGLRVGEEAIVDGENDYVLLCLERGYLVPVEEARDGDA